MVKVISEHLVSSISVFVLVSDVFRDWATPLKLVSQVDHINQVSFFPLPRLVLTKPSLHKGQNIAIYVFLSCCSWTMSPLVFFFSHSFLKIKILVFTLRAFLGLTLLQVRTAVAAI